MRIAAIIFIVFFAVVGCKDKPSTQGPTGVPTAEMDSTQFTTIQWLDSVKTFGKINEGEKLEMTFRFKNTGDKPLVISMIKPSCGCTLVDIPEKPFAPGQTGEIKGAFNSEGKPGMQHKTIYVSANTKGSQGHTLEFMGEVVPKAK